MEKNCIIIFHLSTGDNFTCYAFILSMYDKYENIHIFSLYRNKEFIKQLYENHPKIIIHVLDQNYNSHIVPLINIHKLQQSLDTSYIIETGTIYKSWNDINEQHFWRKFYIQANVDYNSRYFYNNINRNIKIENDNYNNLISIYGNKYIFVHDHRNIFYDHYNKRRNVLIKSELPIFHPNINYYESIDDNNNNYNLWNKNLYKTNLLDYCKIIENAEEIHISDSAFSCLCPYLNLSKVNNKCIYTNFNIINYHESFKNWKIINI
jgi:hypothetical protein